MSDAFASAGEFLKNVAIRFISNVGSSLTIKGLNSQSSKGKPSQPANKGELVRRDNRSRQAELEYYEGKAKREKELVNIQADLAKYREIEVKAGMQIAAAQAEFSEKALQLRRQELDLAKARLWQEGKIAKAEIEQVERALQLREQELQLLAEELTERRKLSYLYLDLMREKQAKEIEQKLSEIQANWDKENWSGILSREEMLKILVEGQRKHRLLMLVSPPDISEDCPESFIRNLKMDVRSELKEFLEQHYPLNTDLCPVEFYGKYFKSSVFDAEVKQLETLLASVPTAIIYSDITDQKVYLHIGFWGLEEPLSLTMPWNWEQEKERLEAEGLTEKESLKIIRQSIVKIHQLIAAFLADLYYLNINPNHEPRLFQLESELSPEWVQRNFGILREIQKQKREAYERELRLLKQSQTWKCLHSFTGFLDSLYSISISPDGHTLSGTSYGISFEIKEIKENRIEWIEYGSDLITNKLRLGQITKLWNLKTGKLICAFSGGFDAFSPNGQIFVGKENKQIKLWNLCTAKLLYTLCEHSGDLNFFTFSPDGQLLASSSDDNTIIIWNTSTGELLQTLRANTEIRVITFNPDGQLLASCSNNNTIKIWNPRTGELTQQLSGHSSSVVSLTFNPNGQLLASGSEDKTIKIWHPHTGKVLSRKLSDHSSAVYSVTFSSDGQLLSSRSGNPSKVWNPRTGDLLHTIPGEFVAFSCDSQRLVTNNNGIFQLWHPRTAEQVATLSGEFVAFTSDGQALVTKSEDETTGMWNLQICNPSTGQLMQLLPGHSGSIEQVVFSQDGKTLVSLGGDLTLKVWRCGEVDLSD